jgi:formylglycine-generating enzyme required for sulfatase activity
MSPFLLTTSVVLLLIAGTIASTPRQTRYQYQGVVVQSDHASAARQAESEITKLKQGQSNQVWSLLRHTSNPSVRTFLIHSFARLGVNPSLLIRRLEVESDVSARRALILSLGEFNHEHLPEAPRRQLIEKLSHWYRNDRDPGTHSAIDWLLRHSRQGERPRQLDWQATKRIEASDRTLAGQSPGVRDWYVTREGHTMIIIRQPGQFTMGSPPEELGRSADETQYNVLIPRAFAVASKEVTVAQYQRFLEANNKLEFRYPDPTKNPRRGSPVMQSNSPEDECPQIAVTWYEAAQYCNWLSRREGIPESEWVYPENLNEIKSGMKLRANYLQRTGYRLLTEAEWEFAARSGSTTSHFYGSFQEMLDQYAVYSKNPPKKKGDPNDPNDPQRTWRVGQLKPNDLGLFDVYGNVWEWIHDRRIDPPLSGLIRKDVEDQMLVVNDQQWRMRRGGSFTYEASTMRSAYRGRPDGYAPNERRDSVGFRVARTYR